MPKGGASSVTTHFSLKPNSQRKTALDRVPKNGASSVTTHSALGPNRQRKTAVNCRGTHPPLFHRSEHSRRPTAHQASTVTPMLHLDAFLCPLLSHVELWLTCRAQISRRQETCGSKKRTCKTVGEPKRVNGTRIISHASACVSMSVCLCVFLCVCLCERVYVCETLNYKVSPMKTEISCGPKGEKLA